MEVVVPGFYHLLLNTGFVVSLLFDMSDTTQRLHTREFLKYVVNHSDLQCSEKGLYILS